MSQKISLEDIQTRVSAIYTETQKRVIGQDILIRNILIALFSGGHILLEGVPGLAKTLTVETISQTLGLHSARIQFTPDLLPGDLTGGQMYNQAESKFYTNKGPIFTNFLLADEINRAPAKVQSALLEAMQERQVTIGGETFTLPTPFIVLATQNPIEQEGTYPLPEAQLDRFLLKTLVDYPTRTEEIEIMKRMNSGVLGEIHQILSCEEIISIQQIITEQVHVDEKIYEYVANIVLATRNSRQFGYIKGEDYIDFGASPRASIALIKTAKVLAVFDGRSYVTPEDIQSVVYDVLRHRIGRTFEAIGQDIGVDQIIREILENIVVV
ncbi:ATPase [Candidatus Gracilibacteria bacterium CG2_30_37_12]|nr:MAG: ATPase [Candidatus Gracilibacteria bacterium CG2_30_37_12]